MEPARTRPTTPSSAWATSPIPTRGARNEGRDSPSEAVREGTGRATSQRRLREMPLVNSQAQERTGYPTQKPLALLDRIIKASSNPGDVVLDPFCGYGHRVRQCRVPGPAVDRHRPLRGGCNPRRVAPPRPVRHRRRITMRLTNTRRRLLALVFAGSIGTVGAGGQKASPPSSRCPGRCSPRITRAHSRFPGHALTPTGVMAIRCKQFHLPDL